MTEVDIDFRPELGDLRTFWNRRIAKSLDVKCPVTGKPSPLFDMSKRILNQWEFREHFTVLYDGDLVYFFDSTESEINDLIEMSGSPDCVEIYPDLVFLGICLNCIIDCLVGDTTNWKFRIFSVHYPHREIRELKPYDFDTDLGLKIVRKILSETRSLILPIHLMARQYLKIGEHVVEVANPILSKASEILAFERAIAKATGSKQTSKRRVLHINRIIEYRDEDFANEKQEEVDLSYYYCLTPLKDSGIGIMRHKSYDFRNLDPFSYKSVFENFQTPRSTSGRLFIYIGDEVLFTQGEIINNSERDRGEVTLRCYCSYVFDKSENPTLQAAEPEIFDSSNLQLVYLHTETCYIKPKIYHRIMFSLQMKIAEPILRTLGLNI